MSIRPSLKAPEFQGRLLPRLMSSNHVAPRARARPAVTRASSSTSPDSSSRATRLSSSRSMSCKSCFSTSSSARHPTSDPAKAVPAGPTGQTVALDYEHYPVPKGSHGPISADVESIVVCHGLFGSKQNWRSLGRSMAQRFGVPVYAVDLRNHGTSPHIEGLHYQDMAADLLQFFQDHQLKKVVLIGHSMGGKVSLALTLSPELPPDATSHLISVDMSPARGPLSTEFENYIEAMLSIQNAGVKTRIEADEILQKTEPDLGVRQFLLTNLHRLPPDSPTWSFRVPLENIKRNISQIGDFPYDPPNFQGSDGSGVERKWDGKTIFVKGEKSKYLNRRNLPICNAFFPNMKLVTLPTGHWVQAEKPREFVEEVEKFLKGS